MAEDKTYNGWKGGRATWLVNLWIDNERAWHEEWRERARAAWDEAPNQTRFEWQTCRDVATYELEVQLKEWVEDLVDEVIGQTSGLVVDLMSVALGEVDWREIAEHMLAEVDTAEGEEVDDEVE